MNDELMRSLDRIGALAGRGGLQTAGLLMARILPLVIFTPLLGGQSTPRRMRVGVAALLALALLPGFATLFSRPLENLSFALLVGKEALLGFTMAFCVMLVFEIFKALGELIDLARGATMANVLDPLTQNQESTLSFFFMQFSLVLFFAIGGHHMFLGALADSFVAIPPHEPMPGGLGSASLVTGLIRLGSEVLLLAVRLAAPVLVVMLLLDVALGLVNRVAPQIQVYFISLTIKGSLGIFMVLAGMALFISGDFLSIVRLVRKWMLTLGG